MVIGNGPYTIPAKEVIRLAYALVAADDSTHLMAYADSAKATWERLIPSRLQDRDLSLPQRYSLSQNYPNPFNPVTTINYELPVTNYVELAIYNLLGQKVITLVNEKQAAGNYSVEWDASQLAGGVYYYRLKTDMGFMETKKLVLLK
jgi:hypothetical protein